MQSIFKLAQNKAKNLNLDNFTKIMEYNTKEKAKESLHIFLDSKTLIDFFDTWKYDFKHTSSDFYIKLCSFLSLDLKEVYAEIKEVEALIKIQSELSNATLSAKTDFKRSNESIGLLQGASLESKIKLDLKEEKDLEKIPNLIKEHYQKHNGELVLLGKITHYLFSYKDKSYKYNTQGEILEESKRLR